MNKIIKIQCVNKIVTIYQFVDNVKNTITHLVLVIPNRTHQNHLPNTEGKSQLLGQAFKELFNIYTISLPITRQRYN